MQRVPNWYRWLLIAGATLIMCACRAPLIAPGLTDLPLVASTESWATRPIASTDTVTTQNHRPSEGRKLVAEEAVVRKFIHDGTIISPEISPDARRSMRDYPDEYICVGGDANSAVQVLNDRSPRNLDAEDTIGHFDTLDGRVVVQPSNRICIYAPRFAATRKVTAAYANEMVLQPVTAQAPLVAVTHKVRQGSDLLLQNLALQRHLAIQRATVFRDRIPVAEASQRQSLIELSQDLQAHEHFRVIRIGVHKQAEKARLAEFAEAAINWSHDTAVQVVMNHVVAQSRLTVERVEEFFSFAAKGSPKMRVIKTASRADALPGEVIEFTVRFDNVGHQAIGNVTIIDNLTTRLEYIQKTDECSIGAEFSVDNNDAESLTLRWEIAEPLNTGQGGIIRFKCRVR